MNLRISTAVVTILLIFSSVVYGNLAASVVSSAPAAQGTTAPGATLTPIGKPAASPTPAAGTERTYTVVPGDNPWLIAQKVYGNGSKYPLILSANGLTEQSRLTVGTVLIIPPLTGAAPTTAPTAEAPTPLPQPVVAPPTPVPPTKAPATREPAATATATAVRPSPGAFSNLSQTATNPDLPLILDILGWICTLSSLICAFLAYQAYHRVRRLQRMMIMSQRARARL
jgi:hypothetical protein